MKNWFARTRKWASKHKVTSVVLVVLVIFSLWRVYARIGGTVAPMSYVFANVSTGTVVSSVSASGQVSTSNQLDVQAKASGEIISLNVTPGQKVYAGQLLAVIDPTSANKAVRDAKANLESAEISLEKQKKGASALSLTQAQNALANAEDTLNKQRSDSKSDVVNTFLDMPDIVTNLEDILTGTEAGGPAHWNIDYYENAIETYDSRAKFFRDTAYNDFISAKAAYDIAFSEYQSLPVAPDDDTLNKALADSYKAVDLSSKALSSAGAFIQLYIDIYKAHNFTIVSAANTSIVNIGAYTAKLNSHLSSLLADINALKQEKQSIIEKSQSLEDIQAGTDPLDIRSAELSLTKAQNALSDANNTLADYYVRAPFAGTIASVSAQKYGNASGVIATLITNQKIAELSLNEVDAAKIALGDKATLTFDAIENLTLTGVVSQIDTIGAVTQGVVSYKIKISFDTQDERIKSGMSVNASIITEVHQDVLVVPSSAVKTQNGSSFVQTITPPSTTPESIPVEIGISDDSNTEIVSGLKEGEKVVARTITATAVKASTASAPSLFGSGRIGR